MLDESMKSLHSIAFNQASNIVAADQWRFFIKRE